MASNTIFKSAIPFIFLAGVGFQTLAQRVIDTPQKQNQVTLQLTDLLLNDKELPGVYRLFSTLPEHISGTPEACQIETLCHTYKLDIRKSKSIIPLIFKKPSSFYVDLEIKIGEGEKIIKYYSVQPNNKIFYYGQDIVSRKL